jgi:hypothetical protein
MPQVNDGILISRLGLAALQPRRPATCITVIGFGRCGDSLAGIGPQMRQTIRLPHINVSQFFNLPV